MGLTKTLGPEAVRKQETENRKPIDAEHSRKAPSQLIVLLASA